jgi:hypothetical protein
MEDMDTEEEEEDKQAWFVSHGDWPQEADEFG